MYIIAGLGNPGNKYHGSRHNIGFYVIDLLAQAHDISVNKLKHKALLGEGYIGGQKVVLAKPQTYMNNSGESLLELKQWYKIDTERIIVVYDDIDLDPGVVRIRAAGSAGTHNGNALHNLPVAKPGFPPGQNRYRPPAGRLGFGRLRTQPFQ